MTQNEWTPLPWPFSELAPSAPPILHRDTPCFLERLLEDCTGLAGVIAAAMQAPECDENDVKCATRLLAEHLHSTLAFWRQWQGVQESDAEPDEA
jgi:hypothetical protein